MNYNQLDPIYKKVMLGESKKYTLYSDGCYVFALAGGLGIDPIDCNNRLIKVGAFMADSTGDKCLLDHTKINLAFPDRIEKVEKYDSYDNVACLAAIDKYKFCIVKVDYDGSPSTVFDTHFVRFIGSKTLFDSLGGKEKPTSTYPRLLGLRVVVMKPVVMPEVQPLQFQVSEPIYKYIAVENKFSEGDLREGMEAFKDGTVKRLEENITSQRINYQQNIENVQKVCNESLSKMITKEDCVIKVDEAVKRALIVPNGKVESMQTELDRLIEVEKKYQELLGNGIRLIMLGIAKLWESAKSKNEVTNLPKDSI